MSNGLALVDYVAFGKSTTAPVLLTALSADCQICAAFPLDSHPDVTVWSKSDILLSNKPN